MYVWLLSLIAGCYGLPDVVTDTLSIEVGPGPDALRLREGEVFTLNCTITNVAAIDAVNHVEWTYENELDNVLKTVTVDDDYVDYYDHAGKTTYTFDHHPTSADAGDYNCTFFDRAGKRLAQKTIRLTCDPVPIEGVKAWKRLKEDDPFRKDYKHVPSYTIYPGDEQVMECRATAYPKPVFRWFRIQPGVEDDDDIGTAARTEITNASPGRERPNNGEEAIADGPFLRIRNANYSTRGYYCCTAKNSDEYSLNMYFLVRVKNPLAFVWPLIGLGIIAVLMAFIVGLSEYLRKKGAAKRKRIEHEMTNNIKDVADNDSGIQMKQLGGRDMQQRVSASSSRRKETLN